MTLVKPRITVFVGFAAFCGYYVAGAKEPAVARALHTILGTMFVSAGACTLNQYIERNLDSLMDRTRNRPIPSGRISPAAAFLFGFLFSITGIVYLALTVNPLAAAVSAFTLATYVFVYTPLKTRTSLNTIAGAIPGALPPVIGWAAARGEINFGAWLMFGIMFIWQLPHFLAIAWIYREDYRRAGMPMLPVIDASGDMVSRQMVLHSIALLLLSLMPYYAGLAGRVYFYGALFLGIAYVALAVRWTIHPMWLRAKQVFWASLVHLAALFALMIFDKA